jgi:uncharacterized protein
VGDLSIQDLVVEYSSGGYALRPINGLSLDVQAGSLLILLGPSGCGKTTLLSCNTPRVTIAKSGALGKPKSEELEAVARVLPKSETRRVYNAVLERYWYHAWWFYAHSIVRGGIDKVHVGLEVKPAE